MLNKAYTRGVNDALRQAGIIKFADDMMANEAADAVAEETMPEEVPGEVPPETTAELAANLSDLAQALAESAQHADAAAGVAEQAAGKTASFRSAAAWLRRKFAEGSTITGTDPQQTNDQVNSVNAEAELDAKNRPGGEAYANQGVTGVGNQQSSGVGAVAQEGPHPKSMGPVSSSGTNSAIEAIKSASILDMIRKLATTTIMPDGTPTPNALTGEIALDEANRPGGIGYANQGVDGVGISSMSRAIANAAVGTEQTHPGTMGPVGSPGSNTVIEQSAKSASEQAYLRNFQTVANKYAQYLPPRLSQFEKLAAIRYLMSKDPMTRDRIALHMSKTAEVPAGLAEYMESEKKDEGKKDEGEEGEEGEKKKEKEEEKKEAAVRNALLRMSRASR